MYLADWKMEQGNPVWLKEDDVVKLYPEACAEYIRTLKERKATRKLSGLIKNAGPITASI